MSTNFGTHVLYHFTPNYSTAIPIHPNQAQRFDVSMARRQRRNDGKREELEMRIEEYMAQELFGLLNETVED